MSSQWVSAVVDRIVDSMHAVLHVGPDEQEVIVPAKMLPEGAAEGSWLTVLFDGDQVVEVKLDLETTQHVRQRVRDKMAMLRKRGRRQ